MFKILIFYQFSFYTRAFEIRNIIYKWSKSVQTRDYLDTIDNILDKLKRNVIQLHFIQYAFIFALFMLMYLYHFIVTQQSYKLQKLETERQEKIAPFNKRWFRKLRAGSLPNRPHNKLEGKNPGLS